MKKAISLFLACMVLLLLVSGCGVKAQKDSLAARAGLTSSSQVEAVALYEGSHPDELTIDEKANGSSKRQWIDLTGTEEGNKYIEALFSDAAEDTEEPEAGLGSGYPVNGMLKFVFKQDDALEYTGLSMSVYRDETPYTVTVTLTYSDDKRWELMQEENNAASETHTYLLSDAREIWGREYIDALFAEQAK